MIQSPWGPLKLADAHIHFFSHRFFAALGPNAAQAGYELPSEPAAELAARWAGELDRHGIERAALIASVPGDEESVEQAWQFAPSRFWPYAMVNPLAPGAVAQLQGALDRGILRAVCFFPAMHGYSIAGDAAFTLIDLVHATRPSTVIFVHCGALSVGIREKLGLPSLFDLRYSNPADLHPVARRYPQLRFVMPHFGAGYFREALMVADLCPNVYLDTSSSNRWMHYEGLDLRVVFRRALDVLGPRRLLFGSDSSYFPRGWNAAVFEAQSKALYELGVSAEAAALIFHDNLSHLLGA